MASRVHDTSAARIAPSDTFTTLIEEHMELARRLAYRYARRGEPVEELVQVAMLGLVQAAKRYDPELGNGFVPFAIPTILGEIRRHFRDRCWAVRIPRPLHDLHRRMLPARERLSARLSRSPTPRELADELGVTQEEILEVLECATAYNAVSLDAPAPSADDDDGRTLGDMVGLDDNQVEFVERREAVRNALAQLPARERRLLALRYYGERTQEEIAEELGISQMHVSRLLTSTLALLRSAVLDDEAEPIHWPVPRSNSEHAA
jgi:RNA polymerase sigma-B factor